MFKSNLFSFDAIIMKITIGLFLILNLISCQDSHKIIFTDTNNFIENCIVDIYQFEIPYKLKLLKEENATIFSKSTYELDSNYNLIVFFENTDIKQQLNVAPIYIANINIETFKYDEINKFFIGQLNDYTFMYSTEIRFGNVYFIIQSLNQKSNAKGFFTKFYKTIKYSNYQLNHPNYSALKKPIKLAGNNISIIAQDSKLDPKYYAVIDNSKITFISCEDKYYFYKQVLSYVKKTFKSGDIISIYKQQNIDDEIELIPENLEMALIFRETDLNFQSGIGSNYYDCVFNKKN